MPLMVLATAVEMSVMPMRPTKLHITLMVIAWLTPMARVPTGSAMAVAASVAPFTKMVPTTRTMTNARNGFVWTAATNWEKLTM